MPVDILKSAVGFKLHDSNVRKLFVWRWEHTAREINLLRGIIFQPQIRMYFQNGLMWYHVTFVQHRTPTCTSGLIAASIWWSERAFRSRVWPIPWFDVVCDSRWHTSQISYWELVTETQTVARGCYRRLTVCVHGLIVSAFWICGSLLFLLLSDKVLIGFKPPVHEIGNSNSRSVWLSGWLAKVCAK